MGLWVWPVNVMEHVASVTWLPSYGMPVSSYGWKAPGESQRPFHLCVPEFLEQLHVQEAESLLLEHMT